ncbi:MAG: rhamnogalacturonan lyase [Butyrivibrio sp.]|nr:rhamnogalacturonan lyase [Butyrivibrio sp.]
MKTELQIFLDDVEDKAVYFHWEGISEAEFYEVSYKDSSRKSVRYKNLALTREKFYCLKKATNREFYIRVRAYGGKGDGEKIVLAEGMITTPLNYIPNAQKEDLNRGLIAVKTEDGIFLSWRFFKREAAGFCATGLTGINFRVYRNDKEIAIVTDSCNYLDKDGSDADTYSVEPVKVGNDGIAEPVSGNKRADKKCENVSVWSSGKNYLEIELQKPEGGVTPAGESFEYRINDMSIGDVDGDGDYEYIVKWDPSNSQDVSIKGYTGRCIIDCYKIDGRLMWRLDMGPNIRAGAHYTQFMVYDFDGDGKSEMAVKTAPGTIMTRFSEDGKVLEKSYITMLKSDVDAGYSNEDNYVCSADDYYNHMVDVFMSWHEHPEVKKGNWPQTIEECFGIEKKYDYPLNEDDAKKLVDYFMDVYAPSRSARNELRKFEGFIYEGPEYLTMFSGDGKELETIKYPYPRQDDGLLWGDYSLARIEPCNRVDRFLAGVAYFDGIHPSLVMCRGYYTRTTIAAYDFEKGHFVERFMVDSGHVPMSNPFNDNPHDKSGTDKEYGTLSGQGDHSLSIADIDDDGCQEIIYGAACIDHDGRLKYSSYDYLPSGKRAKLGHGDSMHVAKIDPDQPGLQIFNVFEGAKAAPFGYALRDAETGIVRHRYDDEGKDLGPFGYYAETDLGRCMIGDIDPDTKGLQVWVNDVYSCDGKVLDIKAPSTNQAIRWAADLTTQVLDRSDYLKGEHRGVVNDITHGVMLDPEDTLCNNGTKGNACLVASVFGDFREDLILRRKDDKAIRIYTNTEITNHKLYTPMDDIMYRVGIAWQNTCYNQTCYTSYYYASDMDFKDVPLVD